MFTKVELMAVIPLDMHIRLKGYSAEFSSPDKNPIHIQHSLISFCSVNKQEQKGT